jgi:4-hydroxy-3-polyprenylbenzoate decarboxylase
MKVERVYHRPGAIWPFTVVGRPPQEDTIFGALIHELTGPIIPTVLPGVRAVHAVDATGVHPLLLAVGSERYVPYADRTEPQELLTQANAILGQGQLSLAKYLFIVAESPDTPDVHDVGAVLRHLLERFDPARDLHFQTRTTIDTLDYSGEGLNRGSKLVLAAVGPPRRTLPTEPPPGLRLPDGFRAPRVCLPGVLAVEAPRAAADDGALRRFCAAVDATDPLNAFPLVVLVDDSAFCARTLDNFLWVTFTRSNPAVDVDGVGASTVHKHWGCRGAVVIDARIKPHHAPPLVEDPAVTARVDALFAKSGPLSGLDG